ncbi:CC_3452 family protein [Parasphingorhabdus sp.]|uniref:CC_3452 family protein n=1 Tax=Parasphingorhabdus sp. TaxID=2709688 RepID=UPI0030030E27
MLLSQSPLRASILFSVAAMTSLTLFTATTATSAEARTTTVAYTAELQAPVEASQEIIKGTVIRCAGTECIGGQSNSAPRTICAKIADEFGPVASFAYKGEAFDTEALAQCNG